MTKKNSLGRGLGALIENADEIKQAAQEATVSNIDQIAVEAIDTNPFQPRTHFEEDALNELADSIRELGIIQPITVRRLENGHYQLITGERRLRASRIAGLSSIPAYVREANDQAMLEMALVENIQREDLDPIEISISYQRLIDECSLTQEELSPRVGKNRATISNYLRLLKLPAEVQLGLRHKQLSMGHARAIIPIEDPALQLKIFHRVVNEELSVRKTEEVVRDLYLTRPTPEKQEEALPQQYEDLKNHLVKHFNVPVDFKRTPKGSGKIIISFRSDEDLERIIAVLDKK